VQREWFTQLARGDGQIFSQLWLIDQAQSAMRRARRVEMEERISNFDRVLKKNCTPVATGSIDVEIDANACISENMRSPRGERKDARACIEECRDAVSLSSRLCEELAFRAPLQNACDFLS